MSSFLVNWVSPDMDADDLQSGSTERTDMDGKHERGGERKGGDYMGRKGRLNSRGREMNCI